MPEHLKDTEFELLKQSLLALGYARPGSLLQRFTSCGNPTCKCMADPPQLHGPYYQWTYKVAGKTKTIRLSAAQAKACTEWCENHKRLKAVVREIEDFSLKKTDGLLATISGS